MKTAKEDLIRSVGPEDDLFFRDLFFREVRELLSIGVYPFDQSHFKIGEVISYVKTYI